MTPRRPGPSPATWRSYTMNAKAAAQLANALRPKAAVPYHYGSVVGSEKDAREFIALLDPAIEGKLLLEE